MKRILFSLVMGFLCLSVTAQDATKNFYKKGEFMIGISPGYSQRVMPDNQGVMTLQDVLSNRLTLGYFIMDRWQVGVKVQTDFYRDQSSINLQIPNVEAFSRYYVGKGAWRPFFEVGTGLSKVVSYGPLDEVQEFRTPYLQGSYGVAFRPGKGKMSLEISSPLINISKYGTRASLLKPNLGINFHF